jgi:stage V sporulation protein G
MEITEVRIFPAGEERLKAYVTITLDDCFVVRDLKVIIAHPLNSETRERMEKTILAEYEREIARGAPALLPEAAAG